MFTVLSATFVIFAAASGVTVTLSPVLSSNSVCPSVPSMVSSPKLTVYVFFVCAFPSYVHSPSADSTFSSFVLFLTSSSPIVLLSV